MFFRCLTDRERILQVLWDLPALLGPLWGLSQPSLPTSILPCPKWGHQVGEDPGYKAEPLEACLQPEPSRAGIRTWSPQGDRRCAFPKAGCHGRSRGPSGVVQRHRDAKSTSPLPAACLGRPKSLRVPLPPPPCLAPSPPARRSCKEGRAMDKATQMLSPSCSREGTAKGAEEPPGGVAEERRSGGGVEERLTQKVEARPRVWSLTRWLPDWGTAGCGEAKPRHPHPWALGRGWAHRRGWKTRG